MRVLPRRTLPLLVKLAAGLLLAALGGWSAWRALVIPYAERAIERAVGYRVVIGSLYPGVTTLRARDVVLFGAPPFGSAPLARVRALDIRLGGAGRGLARPSAVLARGVHLTYLRAGAVDNVRGAPGAAEADRPGARRRAGGTGTGLRPALAVRDARFEAFIRPPGQGGSRWGSLAVTGAGLSVDLAPDGALAGQLRVARLERAGWGALQADGLRFSASGGRRSLSAAGVRAVGADGQALAAVLLGGALAEAGRTRFWLQGTGPGGAPLQLQAETSAEGSRGTLTLAALPLAVLARPLARAGVDLRAATLSGKVVLERERGGPAALELGLGLAGLNLSHPRLDRRPWSDLTIDLRGGATLWTDGSRVGVDQVRLTALGLPLVIFGFVELGARPRGQWRIETAAPVPCATLLAQAPAPVREELAGLELGGRFGLHLGFGFDAAAWDETQLAVDLAPLCEVKREPAALEALLAGDRSAGGKPAAAAKGGLPGLANPGAHLPLDASHPHFVALTAMPPAVPGAFLTAEDARFFSHPGFDLENIRRALAHDLEVGDFARGASTITQQLAKNLFLGPERTLARKLEEVVLAWRLHRRLRKERILELYLNVIELGPGIRGIKRAAEVYFGKPVSALGPLEAAHLAALTPNPQGLSRRFRDGRVDEGWLRKLYDLLSMMNRSGRLSRGDLAAARKARLVLRRI